MIIKYNVKKDSTIEQYLYDLGFSSKISSKLKGDCFIKVNGIPTRKWQAIYLGDTLEIELPIEENNGPKKNGFINIIYEDEYFLVINKIPNLAVMPTKSHYEDNLSNYIAYYFEKNNIHSKVHLVNRLDYATRGLILIAKHQLIHGLFSKQDIQKKYIALVDGCVKEDGIIERPIKKDDFSMKRIISDEGLYAKTIYKVIKTNCNRSLLDITLITGRTHQIRVHLNSIGHPIVGDVLYGTKEGNLMLQSYYLAFQHPITLKDMEFSINMEKDFII